MITLAPWEVLKQIGTILFEVALSKELMQGQFHSGFIFTGKVGSYPESEIL